MEAAAYVFGPLVITIILALPLIPIARSTKKLTWAGAIGLGTLIMSLSLLLIAEVPSKILYLFSQKHVEWERFSFLRFALRGQILGGQDTYAITADIVANTVQGVFFVILVALGYMWSKKRFSR